MEEEIRDQDRGWNKGELVRNRNARKHTHSVEVGRGKMPYTGSPLRLQGKGGYFVGPQDLFLEDHKANITIQNCVLRQFQ